MRIVTNLFNQYVNMGHSCHTAVATTGLFFKFLLALSLGIFFLQLYEKCRKGELVYGCLETWLLWRLTGGQAWCTDVSCISATGAFDPSIVS